MFETYSSNRKVPTGIPIIDHLLDGGLERGSSVLVKAHPLADPSAMIIQLLHQRLESGDIGLYFVNNKTPESVIEESTNSGMNLDDFKRQNQLVFIDSFSALFGLRSKEIYAIDNIEDAASISKVVSSALSECSKKGKVFLIFDALNTSLDEVGESILSEIGNWSRIAVAYDAILCFLYTEWNYSTSVSEAVATCFPLSLTLCHWSV
jgi:KaiC/GvpD/RAD55 family RecA-like ATPase